LDSPLLRVDNLKTYFNTPAGISRAVDGVSFQLQAGETMAIVGESGSGKSMTALSILQLVPEPAGYIDSGTIRFNGQDLLDLTWEQMRSIRGRQISMIFQEPMTSLNPVFTIGYQMREAMLTHNKYRGAAATTRAISLLERVGMQSPDKVLRQYPHELSGGMRQRVMIAIALANEPQLLLADEPTTALDVTIQAQILTLLRQLQRDIGMSMLLITHDLGIVSQVADKVAVMYAGQLVEQATTYDLLTSPLHPYTQGLIASLPARSRRGTALFTLEGVVPPPTRWPSGCRFHARCSQRLDRCDKDVPLVTSQPGSRSVSCHLYPALDGAPKAMEATI
jgi:oligopeptide/dipeptide ABC transporter ATP-binding protein